METLDCIKTRRSIRKFSDKEVPNEIIEKVIEAAKYAPSSHDSQPWQFFIIRSQDLKNKLAELDHEDNRPIIKSCAAVILICVDLEKSSVRYIEDGVLAAQNIQLAIHDLGLGSVYFSAYKSDDDTKENGIRKTLDLLDNLKPIALLLFGYPAESDKLEPKAVRENMNLIEYI